MNKPEYLEQVRQTDEARALNGIHHDAMNDPSLDSVEKDEIASAVQNKFAAMNSDRAVTRAVETLLRKRHPRVSQKVLPMLTAFLIFSFAVVPGALLSAPVLSPANAGRRELSGVLTPLTMDALFGRRLAALSMIESGDDDYAVGKAGEVSRYQIRPDVWRQYTGFTYEGKAMVLDPRNPLTARNVATLILHERCKAFAALFHHPPNDLEFYLLWARPAWPLAGKADFSLDVQDRALRFHNLVQKFNR